MPTSRKPDPQRHHVLPDPGNRGSHFLRSRNRNSRSRLNFSTSCRGSLMLGVPKISNVQMVGSADAPAAEPAAAASSPNAARGAARIPAFSALFCKHTSPSALLTFPTRTSPVHSPPFHRTQLTFHPDAEPEPAGALPPATVFALPLLLLLPRNCRRFRPLHHLVFLVVPSCSLLVIVVVSSAFVALPLPSLAATRGHAAPPLPQPLAAGLRGWPA
eukprot:gene13606-biopygen3107